MSNKMPAVPSTKPVIALRPDPEYMAALKARAAKEQRSVAQVCLMIIRGELPPITAQELAQHDP